MKTRKILCCLVLLCALCAENATAQIKAYVCEGYDDEDVNISSKTDISFSADKSTVTVGKETFNVEDVDSILFHKPKFNSVDIVWNGNSATVTIPSSIKGVTSSVSGGHVTITSTNTSEELLYVLSGNSSNGSLTLNGKYKLRMHLNGVSLTSSKGAALDIECGKRVEVKLMKGTTNYLEDCTQGSQKAAFYTKGHLEIKGKGTLNVKGKTKHAICAKEYLQLKTSTGIINILGAVSDGIHCGEGDKSLPENCRFIMNGGNVTISGCGSDCIDSDDYGSMFINGGTANLNVSQSDGAGLKCDSIIYMTDGNINLNVTGTISQGIRFAYDAFFDGGKVEGTISGNGSKGFKAKKTTAGTTVNNGGDAHFRGTDVTLTLSAGTYTADGTKCGGIRVDKDMYQTDGAIHITKTNSAAVPIEVKGTDNKTGGTRVED